MPEEGGVTVARFTVKVRAFGKQAVPLHADTEYVTDAGVVVPAAKGIKADDVCPLPVWPVFEDHVYEVPLALPVQVARSKIDCPALTDEPLKILVPGAPVTEQPVGAVTATGPKLTELKGAQIPVPASQALSVYVD